MIRACNMTRGFGSVLKYIQGPGEINNLAKYIKEFGSFGYILIDSYLYSSIGGLLDVQKGLEKIVDKFEGEVTVAFIEEKVKIASETSADVVVGIGGGKTVDAAKAIAAKLNLPIILVPTIASTDAPVASMTATFDESGMQTGIIRFANCPSMVLVDSEIIVQASARYFAAGIGDALATCYEAKSSSTNDNKNFIGDGFRKTIAGMAICEACEKTIFEKAVLALKAVEQHVCTPDVEDVIEANTLLSGLGFLNVGLAGAHATNTGLTVLAETKGMLHGELVAFGILVHLIVEQYPKEELFNLYRLLDELKLPITLADLGIKEMTKEMLDRVTKKACAGFWTRCPKVVTEKVVGDAILFADALGNQYRTSKREEV